MPSIKAVQVIIYIGVVLSFLAVPVGSYFLVTHYRDKNSELVLEKAKLEKDVALLESKIKFAEDVKTIVEDAVKTRDETFKAIDAYSVSIDDATVGLEDRESSEVLKKTVRIMKESTK